MAVNRIKVSNFKSFDELEVDLRPLNVVVGGNAAGKSNFLEIFKFLRDLATYGLEDAVSLQGGIEYLTNLRIGAGRPVSIEAAFDFELGFPLSFNETEGGVNADVLRSVYHLAFQSGPERDLKILKEELIHYCGFWREGPRQEFSAAGEGKLSISRRDEDLCFSVSPEQISDLGFLRRGEKITPTKTILGIGPWALPDLPTEIDVFDFDPKMPKKPSPLSGRVSLEPDGSNLAIVLRALLQDRGRQDALVRILRDALPFVDDLRIVKPSDSSLQVALKERFSEPHYIPSSFLSDGTIHLVALVVALYFQKAAVTIIEEPERHVHPHLISKVVAMLKDTSQSKQVIVTTHNPEVVKNVDLEDILLMDRNENGFSRIVRPAESQELKVFLENDLGVDELYVQDLLGVGHGI